MYIGQEMEAREILDQALETVGGNQAELARRLGRSETTVSRWRNERNGIDMESALRLARLTHLPPRQVVAACGLDPQLVPVSEGLAGYDAKTLEMAETISSLPSGLRQAVQILIEAGARGITSYKQWDPVLVAS